MTWYDTMDAEAARHRRPMDRDVPLYGERTTWGSNERPCYPCVVCSGPDGLTLVRPDDLAGHAKGHEEGYAEWLDEQGPEAWVPAAIAEQEAYLARCRAERA
jgi:hypothetical protein